MAVRTSPGQVSLGFTRDIRTPQERHIDNLVDGFRIEASATRMQYQSLDERFGEIVASRVEMGCLSRDEFAQVMRKWRS